MSRIHQEIERAVASGRLAPKFRAADWRRACPGWADNTYGRFLPKHVRGNGKFKEYFERHDRGLYSLIGRDASGEAVGDLARDPH